MFISKLNSRCVLTVVKICYCRQNVLNKTNLHFFDCLATADLISISVSPTKGSGFIIKKETKPETIQDCLKVQRCSCK